MESGIGVTLLTPTSDMSSADCLISHVVSNAANTTLSLQQKRAVSYVMEF